VYGSSVTRGVITFVAISIAVASCKCGDKAGKKQAPAPAVADAGPKRLPGPTEPDPDYEARRDELLRRGDPAVMKDAPVVDQSKPPAEATATDLIKTVSKDVMMVKSIRVDLAKRRLEIPGTVTLQKGMLEFIAVAPAGKTYESMLSVDASAVQLRLALTLLGFEGTQAASPGQTLTAALRLKRDGKDVEVPIEDVLIDRRTGKAPKDLRWWVTAFGDAEKNEALSTNQLVSLVAHERFAPLRVEGDTGNPYAGPDQGLTTDPEKVPAVTTPVTLILMAPK
jgi:hypothetical protein